MSFLVVFVLILIIAFVIDSNKKSKTLKEFLYIVGVSDVKSLSQEDCNITVKSRATLNKYDDIKFFKEKKERLEKARKAIEYQEEVKKRINEFLLNNNYKHNRYYKYGVEKLQELKSKLNGYVIKINYITNAGNNLDSRYMIITKDRVYQLIDNPELLMSKTEYNQLVKQQSKERLEKKRKLFYDRVNKIIDIANERKDKLIVQNQAERIDALILKLLDKPVNSIQKIKSADSEEWAMLDNFITQIGDEVRDIIKEDEKINAYYASADFENVKSTCEKLIQSQKEFNEYIDEKAKSVSKLFGTRVVRNGTQNEDQYNYIRTYKKTLTPFTAEVSSTVFGSAENNPIDYVIKYFYPNKSEYKNQIDKLRTLIEELETLKEAKVIIDNYKKQYKDYIDDVPPYILELDENGFYSRLGFATIDESVLEIEYKFVYTSNGGMAQRSFPVPMTEDTIAELIKHLENKLSVTAQAKEQRALMTKKLRLQIKERDNYTCCLCGNSVYKEPNLLLEIDHIVPISKGGLTEENNLQTLCWKCNRAKSDKMIDA